MTDEPKKGLSIKQLMLQTYGSSSVCFLGTYKKAELNAIY